jgi:Tetracyclin repressor-like, C-terminal domain
LKCSSRFAGGQAEFHRQPSAGATTDGSSRAAAPLLASRPVMPTKRLEQLDAYARLLMRAGFTEDRAMDVLRTVYMYAHGYALAEACFTACAGCGPWPADKLSRMRRVTKMVPRDAPDHLLRLAMLFCGRCDMDEQFNLGTWRPLK